MASLKTKSRDNCPMYQFQYGTDTKYTVSDTNQMPVEVSKCAFE